MFGSHSRSAALIGAAACWGLGTVLSKYALGGFDASVLLPFQLTCSVLLLGGFLVGPFALGLAHVTLTAEVFAELGVVILLFTVGLEVRLDDLLKVGPMAIAVGSIGFILPIIAGLAIGLAIGEDVLPAALMGLALAATSIGITSRVLAELGVLDRAFSRVILGAAIVDDILALLAIGVLSGLAEGELGVDTVLTLGAGLAFVAIGLALAPLGRRLPRKIFVWPKFADTPVVPVFIIMFAGALLAQFVGLAAIIGAFVVGLLSGLVVGPCTAPVLGGLLLYVGASGHPVFGATLLFTFALGIGVPVVALGTFAGLLANLPKAGRWTVKVQRAFGVLLLLAGEYLLLEAGKRLI